MGSSSNVNFTYLLFLWPLLLSPIYSDGIYSSSDPLDAWITKTVEETVTVGCSTTALPYSITPYLSIYTSTYNIVSGTLTIHGTSYVTVNYPPDTTNTLTTSTPLTAIGNSLISLSTPLTTSDTHLATTSMLLTTTGTMKSSTLATPSGISAFSTQTESVLPGASAITIWGTPVSLGLSGTLVIGTNAQTLLEGSSDTEVFTIGNQLVTVGPTGFEFVHTLYTLPLPTTNKELTVVPGGTPITIGTVPISLGQGGTLVIAGTTQVIATRVEIITVNGETITASSGGFVVELPTSTMTGLTTVMAGTTSFIFSTSFLSINSLTTWSQTTTELLGQAAQTILPIWPCLSLCDSGYNGVMIIPESPLPPSSVIIPPPFTFTPLTIGSNGLPTAVLMPSPSLSPSLSPSPSPSPSITLATVSATTTLDSISSTMTTIPPGFSTEASMNTLWTANTWLTTDVGGMPTIVPVLVGCPGCGGHYGGIILWNLPELPWVSFQFPGFPGLPKFHVPCIKIFGITISGDCNNPPSTDGDNPNNPPNTEKPKDSTTAQNQPTTVTSSTQTASSTSTCSFTGVTSCSQLCDITTQSNGVIASSCGPAVCQTITACSAMPTTSTIYSVTNTSLAICAPTCSACAGGSSAAASAASPSFTPSGLAKRVLPGPDNPEDEEDVITWFLKTMASITTLEDDLFETAPGEPHGLSSSLINPLTSIDGIAGAKGDLAGVEGIYGCSVVVVATPEAIWLAHMWQTSFLEETFFKKDVLDFMFAGAPSRPQHWPGLQIFIDDPETHPFSPNKKPVVLIISARDRRFPDVDAPNYPDMVARMRDALQQKFPLSTIREFNYKPADFSDQLRGVFGKILVQYDPAHPDCDGVLSPTIRVWVQGQVVLDAPFYNYPSQERATNRRRDTSNTVCPLSWKQSVTPYEITATYSASAIYTSLITISTPTSGYETPSSSTSSSQTTALSTSAGSSTATGGSLFCFPTSGPGSVPTGLPQNQIAKNITDFCAAIDTNSQVLRGCDNQFHNGILLSVDCNGAGNSFGGPYATDGLAYEYPGITAWLNVSLVQGKSFIVNSSTCNSAFSTVLNDCPPFTNNNVLLLPNKFGGGVFISDGVGGGVNFNILLVPTSTPGQGGIPGCAYVIASDLKSNALCAADYCNCGGTVAPLLTSIVSGSTTSNCAYSTKPTAATCPPTPTMTTSALPSSSSAYQTGTTCNCNEDGCTSDSPPCCANGSCPGPHSQPSHRVRALPTSVTCNCNENSCTPDSPPCCANGSCGI